MKWIYRLLTIAVLGGAMLVPFFMNNNEGKPMFSMPETKDFIPSSLMTENTIQAIPSLPSSSQTFYKWQDEHGTWHYGDTPPVNGPTFSTINVDSNTNVIQSVPVAPKPESTASQNTPNATNTPKIPLSNVLTLDRAMNVLNDAQNVQGLVDNHNAQLEAASNIK
ncbi:MAG: hypothetical protein ACI9T7_003475 [Oleiphilaceae bacterium]|jgi:hypothetical protein